MVFEIFRNKTFFCISCDIYTLPCMDLYSISLINLLNVCKIIRYMTNSPLPLLTSFVQISVYPSVSAGFKTPVEKHKWAIDLKKCATSFSDRVRNYPSIFLSVLLFIQFMSSDPFVYLSLFLSHCPSVGPFVCQYPKLSLIFTYPAYFYKFQLTVCNL